MAADWEKLAKDWEGHAVGLIAEVDCTDPAGKPVCEEFDVEGFPTLMYGDMQSPVVRKRSVQCCVLRCFLWIFFLK